MGVVSPKRGYLGVPTTATHRCWSPNHSYAQVLESQPRLHTSVGVPTAATIVYTSVGVPSAATHEYLESQPWLHTAGAWNPNCDCPQMVDSQARLRTGVWSSSRATHTGGWCAHRGYTWVHGVPTAATHRRLVSQPRLHTGALCPNEWFQLAPPFAGNDACSKPATDIM